MRPTLLPCLRSRPWIGSFTSLAEQGGLMYHVRLLAYYQKLSRSKKRYPEPIWNTFLRLSIDLQVLAVPSSCISCLFQSRRNRNPTFYLTRFLSPTPSKLHLGLQGQRALILLHLFDGTQDNQ